MPHYDTFRSQLAIAHPDYGHALWDPSPGEQYPPVEVGDVGFIRQGKFHRLLNVLYSENHPFNTRFGVPEDHEQLSPVPNHIDRGTLYPKNLCSYGVTVTSGGSNVLAAGPPDPGSEEVSFSCTRKYGAALSLPVAAQREDTLARAHFRQWIIRHINSWFAFSQRIGLGIEMEEILLVTGYHRTRSSTNVVFYDESQVHSRVSFGVQVPGIIGTTVNWQFLNQHIQGAVVSPGPSGENLPEDQCIFIRGFRVERTFRVFSKIKAAAEPNPDPSENDDEPETKVVSIPSASDYRDPLHVLLECIAEQAPDCDLVLVHDDDLERILGVGELNSLETLQPAEVINYLRRSKLEIEVMSDSWSAKDRSPRPYTKHIKVAMLSEQLKSLDARTFDFSWSESDSAEVGFTADEETSTMIVAQGATTESGVRYLCGDCGQSFGEPQEARLHYNLLHPPTHICPVCSYQCRYGVFRAHLLRAHRDVLPSEVLRGVRSRDGQALIEFINTEYLRHNVIPQTHASSTPHFPAPRR